jgi:hypothetical protein
MDQVLQLLKAHGLSKLASYFERAVSDPGLLRTLQQRANAFEFNGQPMRCSIVPELTFDMGSRRLNSQLIISLIDMPQCKELQEVVSRKLGYQPTPENTGVALVIERTFAGQLSRTLGKPAWRNEEMLIVVRLDKGRLVSQHALTPSAMMSIVVPAPDEQKLEDNVKRFNAAIPDTSELIRGLNDSAIAWNGKQFGLVECVREEKLVMGNRVIDTGKFGQFRPADLGEAIRIGMTERHAEFNDPESGMTIPAPGPRPNQPGLRDWVMMGGPADIYGTAEGGSYGGGGAGGGSTVETGVGYSGTGTCAVQYSTLDACYACCDSLGASVLTAGITITTAVTTAGVAAMAPSLIGAVIAGVALAVIGVVGSVAVAYVATDTCKSACTNTLQPIAGGGDAARGPDGEWIV